MNTSYNILNVSANYYPFGITLDNRTISSDSYRYGFQGMELDSEVKGEGNSYTTEFRQYDPRIGRWLSLDPLMAKFPHMSPYVGMNNCPVSIVDPTGLEGEWHPEKDGDGNNILVADAGDDAKSLMTYLSDIYGGLDNISDGEKTDLLSQVDFLEKNVEGGNIEGSAIGSEQGTFDNLVGKYLVTQYNNDKSWGYMDLGGAWSCSPTLAKRSALAVGYVYGEGSPEHSRLDKNNKWEGYIGYNLFQVNYANDANASNTKYGPEGVFGYGVTDVMRKGKGQGGHSIAGALEYSGTGKAVFNMRDLKPGAVVGFGFHTAIFINFNYDSEGNINGFVYWDDHNNFNSTNLTGYKLNIGGNWE